MSDKHKPAWLEDWNVWSYEGPANGTKRDRHGASICIGTLAESLRADIEGREEEHECLATMTSPVSEEHVMVRARIAAAAPAMVRALLNNECQTVFDQTTMCDECGAAVWGDNAGEDYKHAPECSWDAALTAAGFPDQASRDEARKRMNGR